MIDSGSQFGRRAISAAGRQPVVIIIGKNFCTGVQASDPISVLVGTVQELGSLNLINYRRQLRLSFQIDSIYRVLIWLSLVEFLFFMSPLRL